MSAQRTRQLITLVRDYGVVVVLAGLCVTFSAATSGFLTSDNLRNLLEQSAEPGLLACGMTAVIIAGEFDLSVGAILGFGGVICAIVTNASTPVLGIAAALAAGAALGVINGVIVSRTGVHSFLVTLATQFVFVGAAIYLTHGTDNVRIDATGFAQLSDGTFGTLQYKAWIALTGFIIMWLVLRESRLGKRIHALGGNAAAARTVGIRVHRVRVAVFALSGVFAAIAGVLVASDATVAQADGGIGTEFVAITAVIIGGTSIAGGRGSVWRTFTAVLLLAVIANGLNLLYINATYDQLVQGAIILAAVLTDARIKSVSRGPR